MSKHGLKPSRLQQMRTRFESLIEQGELPGLVALVSCHDDIHVEALGTLAFDSPAPMLRDTIFRIASLSKVVVAVAAMILIEDCALRLDDAVDHWLPELASPRVLRTLESEVEDTVPAHRSITVRDLLTYRMGFGSIMAMPGTYPIQRYIREYRLGGDGPTLGSHMPDIDEYLRLLGSLPLIAQPGECWMYHNSGDVLGALIARVSGGSLGSFLQERIFGPLGMKDTAFFVGPEKVSRLPAMYTRNRRTGALDHFEQPPSSAWTSPPAFESGGGGLLSTVDDYFAFSRMLLNMGRYGGGEILSRASVELMTTDQLDPAQRSGAKIFFGDFSSWGLGFAVDIARREIYQNPGRYGWTGGFGTTAYNDPREGVIGILFTQRMMDSPTLPHAFTDFWTLAYAAIE
jgi:CubicO group peptidase (beta-lactamase class C family)